MKISKIALAATMVLCLIPFNSALAGEEAKDETPGVQHMVDQETCRGLHQQPR